MTEHEKKLIATRLKLVSRRELVDILYYANFMIDREQVERLDIISKEVLNNLKNEGKSDSTQITILCNAFDISNKQAREILTGYVNLTGTTEEIVKSICDKTGWDNKINCIKAVKLHFDIGLKEAKDLVDECFIEYNNTPF